jgi:hypothetical protein
MKKDLETVMVKYFGKLNKANQKDLISSIHELGHLVHVLGCDYHVNTSGTERENNPHTEDDEILNKFIVKLCDEYKRQRELQKQ